MYAVKTYASGEIEAIKLPAPEYAKDFIREHVSGAAEQCVKLDAFRSCPGFISIMFTRKAPGLREKPNHMASRLTGWKAVGNALIIPGRVVRNAKGFTIEEATELIDEIQGAGYDDER